MQLLWTFKLQENFCNRNFDLDLHYDFPIATFPGDGFKERSLGMIKEVK